MRSGSRRASDDYSCLRQWLMPPISTIGISIEFVLALAAVAALVLWLTPLLRMRSRNRSRTVQTIDTRARWGVLLEALGYSLLWPSDFWNRNPPLWQLAISIALLALAVTTS